MKTPHEDRTERIFGRLLRLFPGRFRDRYEDEMRTALRDERDEVQSAGRVRSLVLWPRLAIGLVAAAFREHFDDLRSDLRHTARSLAKKPVFTVTTALSLAIGIAATTTVFATFEAIFATQVPGVAHAADLVNVKPWSPVEEAFTSATHPAFRDLREHGPLPDLAGYAGLRVSWTPENGAEAQRAVGQVVSGNYFSVLGTRPLIGRLLGPADAESADLSTVLTEHLWREGLAADPDVLGRAIRINGRPFVVVGVAETGFRGNFIGFDSDLFMPMSRAVSATVGLPSHDDRDESWIEMIGARPGTVSLAHLHDAYAEQAERLAALWPDTYRGVSIVVEVYDGLEADLRGGLRAFVAILFAVSTFVLLIACVNVANLMLGRVVHRGREMAVRTALGAPRSRIVRQLLTESLVLALLGGTAGTLLAMWSTGLVRHAVPTLSGGLSLDVRMSTGVLAVAFATTLAAAMVFGLLPALRGSRADLVSFARMAASRGHAQGAGRLRGGLVVAQVMLTLVILVAAGLFLRALHHAATIDVGFDPAGVHVVRVDPIQVGMDAAAAGRLFVQLEERLDALPEVSAAAWIDRAPLTFGARFFPNPVTLTIPGHTPPPERDGFAIEHATVSPGGLEALGVPLLTGRSFAHYDVPEMTGDATNETARAGVVVVNETFANRFFPDGGLGRTIGLEGNQLEIVGIARDSRYRTLDEAPRPFVYLPFDPAGGDAATLLVRPARAGEDPAATIRAEVASLAPSLPLGTIARLERSLAVSLLPQRIGAAIAGGLGLVGLFMAALGLYGVLFHIVASRAGEIGVRMSVGASPKHIARLVLRQALTLAGLGLLLGVPAAFAVSRLMRSLLHGLDPVDPVTYLVIVLLVAGTALLAGLLPARRAARIDPLTVLREG